MRTCQYSYATWAFLSAAFLGVVPDAAGQIAGAEDWATNWNRRSIDLAELLSGGVPRDGIPPIDAPAHVSTRDAAGWVDGREPVLSVRVGDDARAYPLQVMTWHEIVNDEIGGVPVSVTFCPLCYSAIAYDRRLGDDVLDFGVSGLLRHSDLVMYDRQTESLWQQITGEAIVGDLTGKVLTPLPAQIISFQQFSEAYPDGLVLSRETGHARPYGRNPYEGYDDVDKRPFLYRGRYDDRLAPMEKVVTISLNGVDKAYAHGASRRLRVIEDRIGERPLVILHADGAVSALDKGIIKDSREDGSVGVFLPVVNGRELSFEYSEGRFIDLETRSTWDITGTALDGPLAGETMTALPHGVYFSFVWFAYQPDSELYSVKG